MVEQPVSPVFYPIGAPGFDGRTPKIELSVSGADAKPLVGANASRLITCLPATVNVEYEGFAR